jgi:hypothetical protein
MQCGNELLLGELVAELAPDRCSSATAGQMKFQANADFPYLNAACPGFIQTACLSKLPDIGGKYVHGVVNAERQDTAQCGLEGGEGGGPLHICRLSERRGTQD